MKEIFYIFKFIGLIALLPNAWGSFPDYDEGSSSEGSCRGNVQAVQEGEGTGSDRPFKKIEEIPSDLVYGYHKETGKPGYYKKENLETDPYLIEQYIQERRDIQQEKAEKENSPY